MVVVYMVNYVCVYNFVPGLVINACNTKHLFYLLRPPLFPTYPINPEAQINHLFPLNKVALATNTPFLTAVWY